MSKLQNSSEHMHGSEEAGGVQYSIFSCIISFYINIDLF